MMVPFQQFNTFWQRQTRSQRITLIILVVAVAVIVPVVIMWATTPSYAVAFSGLSDSDAGQVVQKLEADKISYKLRDGGTIMVPSNQVYEVRLNMARQGLPASSTVGFELFSNTSVLGMTEFTEKVNYQRALEGELERTIGSLDAIEAVRVHIVTPDQTLLSTDQAPTTASITVKVRSGQSLGQEQVQSITHLVASAVQGLKPDNVVIVDTEGNMLASGDANSGDTASAGQTDSQRSAEQAAAAGVQKKAQTLLDSVLGPNRSVVQASVVLDWTSHDVTSQTYNPTPAAVLSSQKTSETYTTNGGVTGGVPGASSNLPTPVATVQANGGASTYNSTNETTNYEVSQTQSHEITSPGQIKRISLSVLVDGVTDTKQLATLKTAVANAAGIDTTRGDSLAVDTLAFDRSYYTKQTADMTKSEQTDLYIKIGEAVAGVILLVVLLIYIQRLLKNLRLNTAEAWVPVMKPVSETAALGGSPAYPMMPSGFGAAQSAQQNNAQPAAAQSSPRAETHMPTPAAQSPEDEQMQKVLTKMTEENPSEVAEIIQLWLNEDEEKRG
jgi:flagellar M-ring protein FliF